MTSAYTREELASLYRRRVSMVYQICLMLLKSVPDAEDACQTVFRRALERSEPFRDPEHEKAWLIVTAKNECKNQLKHWWRTRRSGEEELEAIPWEQPGDGEVWEMILALPEKEKMALYLHYYQGYSTQETAELMGTKPATLRTWLFRARGKLRQGLEADDMAYEDLKRVLDQVKPSPNREEAMLSALLTEERMENPMKTRKKLSRLAAMGVAAALLLTTCAFAVVTGLDGRLLHYFGGTPEQEPLLSPTAVAVNREIKDQGSTLHVRQVIADRYSAMFLMDFTAPEGTVLDGDYYTLGNNHIRGKTADGIQLSSWGYGWTLLEDEDPGDNRITLLYRVDFIDGDGNALGTTLTLDFTGLYDNNWNENCLTQGNWKFKVTLPQADPGRYVTPEAPIEIGGRKLTLTSLYLSPISLAWELGEGEDDLESLDRSVLHGREDWPELITLTMADGQELSPGEIKFMITEYKTDLLEQDRGRYCFSLRSIIDPVEVVSVTLFGQSVDWNS